MKQEFKVLFFSLVSAGLLTSCLSEVQDFGEGTQVEKAEGVLSLKLSSSSDFTLMSRSLNENNYRNTSNYTVQILNANNGSVVYECKGSELAGSFPRTLAIGSYRVNAFYGTGYDASRNDFRVEGTTTFNLKGDETKEVSVNCAPTCGKLSVVFEGMSTYFENYNVVYGGTKALGNKTISWSETDSEPWYVALAEGGETINYTINLKAKEEYLQGKDKESATQTGVVKGTIRLERNKAHKLTVKPNYSATTDGGMSLTITIDDSTNDHNVVFEVPVSWI